MIARGHQVLNHQVIHQHWSRKQTLHQAVVSHSSSALTLVYPDPWSVTQQRRRSVSERTSLEKEKMKIPFVFCLSYVQMIPHSREWAVSTHSQVQPLDMLKMRQGCFFFPQKAQSRLSLNAQVNGRLITVLWKKMIVVLPGEISHPSLLFLMQWLCFVLRVYKSTFSVYLFLSQPSLHSSTPPQTDI